MSNAEMFRSRAHIRVEHDWENVLAEADRTEDRRLALLVDDDMVSRRHARRLLELSGIDVVQASNGLAALELIQRLPRRFGLVLTELDLPGISGSVLTETLRLFRPELPTLCMSSRTAAGLVDGRRCLGKPLHGPDLQAAVENGLASESPAFPEAWVARARARYAVAGDLVEAALELARGAGADGEG